MVFVMALVFLTLNLLVDLLYAWLDPRIKYARSATMWIGRNW